MLVSDILRLATRMFRTNRSRTMLTILGISVGIGAILFLVSLGYGLQLLILNQITTSDALLSLDVSATEVANFNLDEEAVNDIKQIPGVDRISPLITTQTQMNIDDISTELVVNFADSDFFRLEGTVLSQGDFYTDSSGDKYKILISASALQLFNLTEEEIFDKRISFTFFLPQEEGSDNTFSRKSVESKRTYRVIGIVEEDSSNYIYMPFGISQELGISTYSKLKVKVDHEDNLDMTRSLIIEKGYSVSALSDIIEQANQIFKIVQIVLASFGIVALIVSAIGMFNTMTIALLERTQEIGIMKALGATSIDIWNMFLAESVIIGLFGGVGGILIGVLGGEAFNYGLNLPLSALLFAPVDLLLLVHFFLTDR